MSGDSLPREAGDKLQQIGSADVAIGILPIPGAIGENTLPAIRETLSRLGGSVTCVILQSEGPDAEGTPATVSGMFPQSAPGASLQSFFNAYRTVFTAADQLKARACCVLGSDSKTVTADWIQRLLQPALEMEFDLVTPHYAHGPLEGLLNSSIIGPLERSLYGLRIQNPLGPDFGLSRRLIERMVSAERPHPVAGIVSTAARAGLTICEARVGARLYPAMDWANVSTLFAEITGPVLQDMERNAPFWQRARGSHAIPAMGETAARAEETEGADVGRLLDSFQLATRNLQEIWQMVLPPATMLELRRMSRLPAAEFAMPDGLWVRVVYDLALAHRLRTISRDHLLRAMTPLYLGWVASYALGLQAAGAPPAEQRLEQLAMAYETAKPYLISRWRWPDRFNP